VFSLWKETDIRISGDLGNGKEKRTENKTTGEGKEGK
jgi:hypothetical protein